MGNLLDAQLCITTINYSGILFSPFQFYSEQLKHQQAALSKIFQSFLKHKFEDYNRSTFKWKLGKIDQKMQKQRYSPLYGKHVGVFNHQLQTQEEFITHWKKQFENNIKNIQGLQYSQQERQRALLFDLLCYKTILCYVYKINDIKSLNIKQIQPYQTFMKKFFSKAFLNQNKKIEKTMIAIDKQQVDVMFFQQANQKLIESFDQKIFKVVKSQKGQSLIIIRKSKFKKIYDQKQILQALGKDIIEGLDWNKDTVIGFADNLILFSGHLSSKKDKNSQQVENMLNSLQRMQKIYPNSHLIVGLDGNSFIKNVPSSLHIYPNKQEIHTTLKMRTMLQPQVSKAQQVASECRDYLITDLNMRKPRVVSILGRDSVSIGYLPCQEHPYDHFVVTAYVNPRQ